MLGSQTVILKEKDKNPHCGQSLGISIGIAIGIATCIAIGIAIDIVTGTGNLEAGVSDRNP